MEELHRIAFRFVRISEVLLVCVCVYIGAVIRNGPWQLIQPVTLSLIITGAQPKAGTGLKMQTVRFFKVTLLGIYR